MPHPGHDRSCIRGRYPGSQLRRRAECRVSRCTAFPGTGPSGMNVHRICLPLRGQRRPCERSSRTCFPFNPVPRYRAPRTQCRRSGTGAHDTTGATEGPNRRAGRVPRAEARRGCPPRPGGDVGASLLPMRPSLEPCRCSGCNRDQRSRPRDSARSVGASSLAIGRLPRAAGFFAPHREQARSNRDPARHN